MSPDEFERFVRIGRQRDAHRLVFLALRDGRLVKESCQVCGSAHRIHGHHRDYSKPLEVLWLCALHHKLCEALEPMLRGCGEVVEIAVEGDHLRDLAEVYAQELTNRQHRNRQLKPLYTNDLCENVEKCLALLLLNRSLKEESRAGNGCGELVGGPMYGRH